MESHNEYRVHIMKVFTDSIEYLIELLLGIFRRLRACGALFGRCNMRTAKSDQAFGYSIEGLLT